MTEYNRMVVFATPSLSSQQCIEGRDSTITTDRILIQAGILPAYIALGGDPYLSKARSKLATIFIEEFPNADTLFFIDDDISWPAAKVLEFVGRTEFLNRGVDVIAGVYPQKSDQLRFPCGLLGDKDTGRLIEHDGLWAASMVPTGFLCLSRCVVQAVYDRSRRFVSADDAGKGRVYREIFKMGVREDGGEWIGEDPWFCDEIRALGFDIWVDPDVEFTHRGSKKWSARLMGNLGEQIRQEKAA